MLNENKPRCYLCNKKLSPVGRYEYLVKETGTIKQICNGCWQNHKPKKKKVVKFY